LTAFERPDNSVIKADTKQKEAYDGFMKIFKSVLPETLGFQSLSTRPPDEADVDAVRLDHPSRFVGREAAETSTV